jgi:hypothetical protein
VVTHPGPFFRELLVGVTVRNKFSYGNELTDAYRYGVGEKPSPWDALPPDSALLFKQRLWARLNKDFPAIKFDHLEVGFTGRNTICVFVTQGRQSCVLHDKTRGFPSVKLMASLTLLGSP